MAARRTLTAVVLASLFILPLLIPALSHVASSQAVELTGDFNADAIAIGRFLESKGVTEVKYSVMAAGDPNSVMRMYGIVEGANKINKIWQENGINVRISIETIWEPDFKKQFDNFVAQYELGQNGDFFVNSYVYIATLVADERLLDITEWVNKYWDNVFSDFYTPLMEAAKYKGKYYAIPQDTEARPLYIRKDVAACMGWDLSGLVDKVKNGEFTWKDVYAKSEEAVKKGCSQWGLIHRKGSAHPDLIQFIFAFGGKLYNPDTGKLVVDREAIYKWFAVEKAFADAGLLPKDILEWDWATQIHPTIVGEKGTLFDIGGTWYWTEWQTKDYYKDPKTGEKRGLTPEEVKEKFYYTLFPAGEPGKKPVTLSQPFMWMIAANAGKDNPNFDKPEFKDAYQKLAFLIVVGASDPEINAIHSIISAHVPVRKAAAALLKDQAWIQKLQNLDLDLSDETKNAIKDIVAKTAHPINIEFLADVSYMLDYTKLAPSHPYYSKLAGVFKDALDRVLKGQSSPEDAVKYIENKVKADPDLRNNVEFINNIPTGWKFIEEKKETTTKTTPKKTETMTEEKEKTETQEKTEEKTETATAEEKGGAPVMLIAIIALIVIVAAAYFLLRK
ncbi:MAG: extracellular solute-binding protein [Desulfurococcales archaeon]|nr:extracellular solute-binding protein [Desulfurococcales archaeon]